jgi:hypothetical protein
MAISAIGMVYLAACHYAPDWLNSGTKPARNPECKMPMLKYNDIYAFCFLLPSFVGNLLFVTGYAWQRYMGRHPFAINEWIKTFLIRLIIGAVLLTLVGYTIWFFFAVRIWRYKTPQCTQGWHQLDMLNFMFLTAFTGWPACVTLVLLALSIICSPFFITEIQDHWNNLSQRAEEKKDIINTIVRTNWDPSLFNAQEECAICSEKFAAEDNVTPLPCDTKHYFHSECIVNWFNSQSQKESCPLCRKQFTKQ